ncbi:SDR family NAD(P)-dependent oxidoreductase [Salibacterium halotolerans]|uniref:3-oxoacyl-[acyl-carrier protein] reductase n=1 Tax=Salibacterium halotolerans TaxID=1884432 RepID=A0A1I5REE5_9BACI|nr:SDR family oxidoreductase [Salibacterium halotolerans]SFP56845.1 3-oxoacyl-[acyl-carrier protein] reductase [Salibacterium halotolerans]
MDLGLKGKKVLVTGGSKGIGKGIAAGFLAEGAEVAIAARSEEGLREARTELGNVHVIQADLISEAERDRAHKEAVETLGSIDILINNVGGSSGSSVEETPLSSFEEAMQLNYLSAVQFSKAVLPDMKEKGSGSIINISSIFGRESGGKATYNNAKAAMISFTKALADEAASFGIRVNSVAPGAILHPSGNWQKRLEENPEKINQFVKDEIPAGRFGTVEEIADVTVFMASQRASWVTGASLNVDGGQSNMNM